MNHTQHQMQCSFESDPLCMRHELHIYEPQTIYVIGIRIIHMNHTLHQMQCAFESDPLCMRHELYIYEPQTMYVIGIRIIYMNHTLRRKHQMQCAFESDPLCMRHELYMRRKLYTSHELCMSVTNYAASTNGHAQLEIIGYV